MNFIGGARESFCLLRFLDYCFTNKTVAVVFYMSLSVTPLSQESQVALFVRGTLLMSSIWLGKGTISGEGVGLIVSTQSHHLQ